MLLAYWNFNIYKQIKSVSSWAEQNASRPSRSHQENELAKVLIGIVITFVCCHALRILLNFHEAITIKDVMACFAEGKEGIPLWPQITQEFSKLMLVTNSSANIIIYCCLNSNFRKNMLSCFKKKRENSSTQASNLNNTAKTIANVETTYCWDNLTKTMTLRLYIYALSRGNLENLVSGNACHVIYPSISVILVLYLFLISSFVFFSFIILSFIVLNYFQ